VINACDDLGALEDNRLVHEQLIQSGYQFDFVVCNSLVDMYAKCGSMWNVSKGRRHQKCFNPNALVGSSLVDMYAKFGSMEDAWRVFNKNLYEQSFEFGIE
jgi:pentatricopeptide repeat protein